VPSSPAQWYAQRTLATTVQRDARRPSGVSKEDGNDENAIVMRHHTLGNIRDKSFAEFMTGINEWESQGITVGDETTKIEYEPLRDESLSGNWEEEGAAQSFWSEGEDHVSPDEMNNGDDITSRGHQLLEKHREIREYARLAAWQLPLLKG
jgi:hypothetical protein